MADLIERAAQLVRGVDARPGAHAASRDVFLRAVRASPRRSPARWVLALTAAVAVAVAAVVVALVASPLTYTVEEARTVHEGTWIRANEQPALLQFSDGSRLELEAGGQAEVLSTTAFGAVVRVSSGVLTANVVHRYATRWQVEAGPYVVRVTGTRFSAAKSGDDQFDVKLFEGSVEVSGPGLVVPLQLKAGQRFHASLERTGARVEVSSLTAAVPKPVPSGAPLPSASVGPVRAQAVARPLAAVAKTPDPIASSDPKPAGWRAQVAAGDFGEVLSAARAEGLEKALLRDVEDVFALGEAARYLREDGVAERSFLAVRRRFRGSLEAAHAALLLGDLAELQARWAEADQWYERCAAEGPQPLIPEALGRRMRVLEHLDQRSQARELAQRYLKLDPLGPWAALARRTLE